MRPLGSCQATTCPRPTPRPGQPAGHPGHQVLGLGVAEAPIAVNQLAPRWAAIRLSSVGPCQGPPGRR